MPLTIQIHHGLYGGFHTSRFVRKLRERVGRRPPQSSAAMLAEKREKGEFWENPCNEGAKRI